jgi:putative OPT family oligopeptide transporter
VTSGQLTAFAKAINGLTLARPAGIFAQNSCRANPDRRWILPQIQQGPGSTGPEPSGSFRPYVRHSQSLPEATAKAIILGALISIVFGAANAYLGLKLGMTVSASIPAAVISMAILRALFRKVTVLENNMVQTIGSAGESLAAGVIFTIPAFFIWNETLPGFHHEISQWQITVLSMLGGALGILFMIPLRKYLVEKEHGKLAFPEGTACAEIIVAGDEGGGKARAVFIGIAIGVVHKVMMTACRLWTESPIYEFQRYLKGGYLGIDAHAALLGVGYIIGPRIAALMMGGAVLGYLGIGPLLAYLGDFIPEVLIPPGDIPIAEMSTSQLRNYYIKYLGVGAVALGGFVSLLKSLPTIVHSFGAGIRQLTGRRGANETIRTDRDMPMSIVLFGSLLVALITWAIPGTNLSFLGVLLALLFGFFFVVVAARIVGLVGSSSSPVSGMTIATLLVTCLILMRFGISGTAGMITAMSVGTIVCIAVCMSGDIAQDLKTGYLLGATPRRQQWFEFVGLAASAVTMGFVVFILAQSFGIQTPQNPNGLLAPQANVMAAIVQGVMTGDLPWGPIMVGVMLGLAIELVGVSSLPFAIGLYLPLSLSSPIMIGGLLSLLVRRTSRTEAVRAKRQEKGILFGSGLVAGDALIGVAVAFVIYLFDGYRTFYEQFEATPLSGAAGPWLSLGAFAVLVGIFWLMTQHRR